MAEKVDIDYRDAFLPFMESLSREGALLVSTDMSGHASGMVIGWGTIGIIWGRHVMTVLVRQSRHTYDLIESSRDFTVNVMPKEQSKAMAIWGKTSGRDTDKWVKSGLRAAAARKTLSPIVEQGILHLECRVLHRHDMEPINLVPEVGSAYYSNKDYHRVFYGEIVACYGV